MRILAVAAWAWCAVFALAACGDPEPAPVAAAPESTSPAPRRAAATSSSAAGPASTERRAAIEGSVTAGGRPARARVEIRRLSETRADRWSVRRRAVGEGRLTAAPQAAQDADGAFAFEGLDPGWYRVTAAGADGASGFADAEVVAAGERVVADLRLFPPQGSGVLRGKVLGLPDGVTRAFVVAGAGSLDDGEPGRAPEFVALDAEARFTLRGLRAGAIRPVLVVPGRLRVTTASVEVAGAGETQVEIDLARLLRRFTVRVVAADGGVPIAGATVTCADEDREEVWNAPETTGADGCAQFLAPPRTLSGTVTAPGLPRAAWKVHAEDASVLVRLRRGADVSVRVVAREGGAPVPGVAVHWASKRWKSDLDAPARTDASGVARLGPVPAGPVQFIVQDDHWCSIGGSDPPALKQGLDQGSRDVQPPSPDLFDVPDAGAPSYTLRVVPARQVEGRVVDERGRPIEGARVVVRAAWALSSAHDPDEPWSAASSGADGRFVLRGLVPQSGQEIEASDSRHLATLVSIPDEGPVEIRLAACSFVHVLVREKAGGAPVEGATIGPETDVQGLLCPDTVSTGPDGLGDVGPLTAGRWSLRVWGRGLLEREPVTVDVEPTDGDTLCVIEVDRGLEIRGRVLRPDGTPLAAEGAYILVGESGGGSKSGDPIGPGGSFRVRGLRPGEYELEVDVREGSRTLRGLAAATAGGPSVDLNTWYEDEAKLVIRVLDSEGDAVPAGQYFFDAGSRGTGSMFQSGRVEIDGGWLPEDGGEATLEVHSLVDAAGVPCGLGAAIVPIPAPVPERLEVRLGPERPIRGIVRDADGRGVSGARIRAHPRTKRSEKWSRFDEDSGHGSHGEAVSAADGSFTLRGLGDLDYSLKAQAPAEFLRPEPVTAHGGATGVSIALVAGVRPRVTVLAPDGSPVQDASVTATESRSRRGDSRASAETGRDGVAQLRALSASASWELSVTPPDSSELLPHRDKSWVVAPETTVRLEQGLTITGVLIGPDGGPLPHFDIAYRAADGRGQSGRTDEDGRFRLGPMRAGEVLVTLGDAGSRRVGRGAVVHDSPSDASGAIRLVAGTKDARLELPAGSFLVVRCEGAAADDLDRSATQLFSADGRTRRSPRTLSGDRLLFTGLVPEEEYAFIARIEAKELVAFHRGWRAGGAETARFTAGAVLTGRVVLPSGGTLRDVSVRAEIGGAWIPSRAAPDGSFRIPALPAVELDVSVHASETDGGWFGFFKATPGGEPVTLRPGEQPIPADGR